MTSIAADSDCNNRVILHSRPGNDGVPLVTHFRYEECAPPCRLPEGYVLLKTCYLSVDPAMRCLMNEDTGVDYIGSWRVGETVEGMAGMGMVVESRAEGVHPGDWVHTEGLYWPWANYFNYDWTTNKARFTKLDKAIYGDHPSIALSLLCALTSLVGIWEKGNVTTGSNQTIVVSGAAGACGSFAGQIGRLLGCSRVVGICGTDEKCTWLQDDLGFDGAINYKTQDVGSQLAQLCPNGVQVYFDNVGGPISDAVIEKMSRDSHVVLCGQVSQYNKDVPYPPPLLDSTTARLQQQNITRERFTVLNYPHRFAEATSQIITWYKGGQLKMRETVAVGLESAPAAFVSMMEGGNVGKQIVHVSDMSI